MRFAELSQMRDAGLKARDAGHIQISRFVAIGQAIWLPIFVALGPGSALPNGNELLLDPRPDVQHAGAQRSKQAFVSRCGEQLATERANVDWDVAQRLSSIEQEQDIALCRNATHGLGRLDRASYI